MFPEIEPHSHGFLERNGSHRIYWEESGATDGIPVVFLHGGPGAGASPVHRRYFDPDKYRIVVFDQRGAGRSRPHASIEENSTPLLIGDMEALREQLHIERWLVFGGSWGATLALAYGIEFPDRCLGFVLRGVFLGSADEVDWFLHGVRRFYPETHRAFVNHVPEDERHDLLSAYRRRLNDPDQAVRLSAARAWMGYEAACSTLKTRSGGPFTDSVDGRAALSLARVSTHYFANDFFLDGRPLVERIGRIRHLPAIIVQGRYDMVCPIVAADRLARAWPGSELVIVPDAGHSAMEPGIRDALVAATEKLKSILDDRVS
ncbi:MAG: prolyl aminopeptidase [Rhodospirillales bacterium]|nr:prolyl aminopeptidase [Rhodospirillales bacterium]